VDAPAELARAGDDERDDERGEERGERGAEAVETAGPGGELRERAGRLPLRQRYLVAQWAKSKPLNGCQPVIALSMPNR
jgi:hypothetical protein